MKTYLLDYYWFAEHKENCLLIESSMTGEQIAELYLVLENELELLGGNDLFFRFDCFLDIMQKFFDVRNVKPGNEEVLKCLDERGAMLRAKEKGVEVLDLHYATGNFYYTGGCSEQMRDRWLPKKEELLEAIRSIILRWHINPKVA